MLSLGCSWELLGRQDTWEIVIDLAWVCVGFGSS